MILITDDDKTCRDSMRRILEREGHVVETAQNVDQALDVIQRLPIDLIVCDYRMPGKSGVDLLMELKRKQSTTPVLMVSAFADSETRSKAISLGAKGFLQKPFRRQELVDQTLKFAMLPSKERTMTQTENILVPFDFSEPSKQALRYAVPLAQQFRARLIVVHVIPPLANFDSGIRERTREIEELAVNDAQKTLHDEIAPICRDFTNFHLIVKTGETGKEILRTIRDEKADLVVMGTHGRKNIERFVLGSTTEHILRRIPVPVLTVSQEGMHREISEDNPIQIRRIVYGADLSSSAESGLRYAADLARTFKAELHLVHAIDFLESGQWSVQVPGTLPFDFSEIQAEAETRFRQALKDTDINESECSIHVVQGRTHDALIQFADERDADLLLINLESRGMLERILLGATAERIIRSSHVPVLSVPFKTGAPLVRSNPAEKLEVHI